MNRRSFFKTLAAATAGFTILPAATTYGRIWRVERKVQLVVLNPEWENAPYVIHLISHPFSAVAMQNYGELGLPRFKFVNGYFKEIPKCIKA
jgi:hypothetical protein